MGTTLKSRSPCIATGGAIAALAMSGCAVLTPRFPNDVQTSVARDDMRRMETDTVVIYYPKGRKSEAERVAARVSYCTRALRMRARVHDEWTDQKPRIVMANLPYNNAYVSPPLLSEPIEVLPAYNTTPYFARFNLPPDPGIIGCHEAVHYVQLLQSGGFHGFVTAVTGSAYTPQIGLEPWFHEGISVYYETKLQGGIGRLGTRYFEGILAAGVAGRTVNGGWMHFLNREPTHGGHYLVGSFFVDWLVSQYGEKKLWQVVERQAHAVGPPFGVNLRFEAVYGKSLSQLIEDFAAHLGQRYPATKRPVGQAKLLELGTDARYHRTRDGWEAIIDHALDRPTRLQVRNPQGKAVVDRLLAEVFPPRKLNHPSPGSASGLSFAPKRDALYFTMLDDGPVFSKSRLFRVSLPDGDISIVADDLRGPGGGLSADGQRYLFARAQGDAWGLASLELATLDSAWIRPPRPGVYFHAPRLSPDGTRILAVRSDERGTSLSLIDPRTGIELDPPKTPAGPALEATWIDEHRILFVGESRGRMQVFVTDLRTGRYRQVSSAPYLAFNPQSDGRSVRFLNREDWHWTLDEVALPDPGGEAPLQEQPRLSPSAASQRRTMARIPPPVVLSDTAYSQLDGLFYPQVRGPWLIARDTYSTVLGVGALGGDRLGMHRWAAGVGVDPAEPHPSFQVDYRNAQLAPLFTTLSVGRYASRERLEEENTAPDGHLPDILARETLAVLMLSRGWYESGVAWGWRYNDVLREVDDGGASDTRRFAGPFLAVLYHAAETTPYTGERRRLSGGGTASYLPKGLSTVDFNVADIAGETGFVVPLPLSNRHTLRIDGRARSLRGAPSGLTLLQVGGGGGVFTGLTEDSAGERTAGVLPPSLRFYEPLRGFEDLALFGSHVVKGELAYRYPIIIDEGTASSLSFLPSTFLREVAFEPFATGASLLDGEEPSWAGGASLDVGTAIWWIPLDFRFQLARRLSDDESTSFFFTVLGAEQ